MKASQNNLDEVLLHRKELGETPLEALKRARKEHGILEEVPMTYAGRLDPMAEGLLLFLAGEAVHDKEKYTALDKTYTFTILFGFSTDTHDLLGRVDDTADGIFNTPVFEKTLETFIGKQEQAYPAYSSKTIDGKPLFEWAREGRLHEITIPSHSIEIKALEPVSVEKISATKLNEEIKKRIGKLKGDFRQEETIALWDAYIENAMDTEFTLATCNVACTSGTYVRALVADIGIKLQTPTTTFSIIRTNIGNYSL